MNNKLHIEIVKKKRGLSNQDAVDLVWSHISTENK